MTALSNEKVLYSYLAHSEPVTVTKVGVRSTFD